MDNVFDSITGEKMHEMVNILASLPPPEKQEILTDTRETCACGKKVHVAEFYKGALNHVYKSRQR